MNGFKVGDVIISIKDCVQFNAKNSKSTIKKGTIKTVYKTGSNVTIDGETYLPFWFKDTTVGAYISRDFELYQGSKNNELKYEIY